MLRGLLIKTFAADYPAGARSNHVQGQLLIQACISKTGDVEELFPISGDDLLMKSAINAVKKWKYKPYIFQGQPVELETLITVAFTLDGP